MDKSAEIREALAAHAAKYGPMQTMLATVLSVDETAFTCVLKEEDEDFDLQYPGVRLRPVLDGNEAMTLYPKVGTWALAIRIEEDEYWMLIAAGEYDKWRLKIGTAIIEQNDAGFLIKKSEDTLRDALILLIEGVEKILVLQGNNPDFEKLAQAKVKIKNILR